MSNVAMPSGGRRVDAETERMGVGDEVAGTKTTSAGACFKRMPRS